jgi:hypothetical protein
MTDSGGRLQDSGNPTTSMVGHSENIGNEETSNSNGGSQTSGNDESMGNTGNFHGKMENKSSTGEPLSYTVESGPTNTDGVNLKDLGGIYNSDAGSKLNDDETTDRNSNDGPQEMATFSHPRRLGTVVNSDDKERIRPVDETIDGNYAGSPDTWDLGKKDNISRQDGGNNGSMWIRRGNSSGTHGYEGIWRWSKMGNITGHRGIITDNSAGGDRKTMVSKHRNDTRDHDGIVAGQKKDVRVHPGIKGVGRSQIHHERSGKKGGNRGHHRIKKGSTKDTTVEQN